jgi:TetR/AcrR family transcriptional regulator, cholesterol catabolism regulator
MRTERVVVPSSRNGGEEDRRSQILRIATELFREKGYHGTSLEDIADRVGFTKPAIYYYFDSKEDLFFAIVEGVVSRALERVERIRAQDLPPLERMHAILVENTRVVLEHLDENTAFYNERGLLSAERERMVRDIERAYTQVLRDTYIEGVASGDLLDVDPTVAVSTLLGATIWVYRWFRPGGRLSIEQVAEGVAELLLNGYRAR